jgi:hypothetical protein
MTQSPDTTQGKLPAPPTAPQYQLIQTGQDRVSAWGQIRVTDAADLQAAMSSWKDRWLGYSPSIYADSVDPCLAHWRRWNTCE